MRTADVLIQAGHEGRTSGATGATGHGLSEILLTPVIADAAVAVCRRAGLSVLRDSAATSPARVKVAVAIHLDGNPKAGAQLLYDDATDRPLADHLRKTWSRWWGSWTKDNTSPLKDRTGFSRYYGFPSWDTTDGEVVFEVGSLGDPDQAQYFARPGFPEWVGSVIGDAIVARLHGTPLADLSGVPDVPYADVAGHWSEPQAREMIARGIMVGDGREWDPDDAVSRGELAVVVDRVLDEVARMVAGR